MRILICISSIILGKGLERILKDLCTDDIINSTPHTEVRHNPDIVIFNAKEEITILKQLYKTAKFIYLDLGLSDSEISCLLYCSGISGVISPSLEIDKLPKVLKKVNQGEIWLDQKHLHLLLKNGINHSIQVDLKQLSSQDFHIIELVSNGQTNKEIAEKLCLSLPTIKAHLSRIFKQFNIHNRAQLAALAAKNPDLHYQ